MNDRLYRSVDDRVLAGVAGGLADRLGIDPSIVRIVWVLLALASGGIFLLVYIVMAIVVPEEDDLAAFPPFPRASAGGAATPGYTDAGAVAAESASTADAASATVGATTGSSAASPAPAPAPYAPSPTSGYVPPIDASQWRAQARAQRRAVRAARRAERGPGQGALVLGVILVLLGVWFLLREYYPALDFDRIWPFALLALGVVLLAFSFGGRPGGPGRPDGPEGQR